MFFSSWLSHKCLFTCSLFEWESKQVHRLWVEMSHFFLSDSDPSPPNPGHFWAPIFCGRNQVICPVELVHLDLVYCFSFLQWHSPSSWILIISCKPVGRFRASSRLLFRFLVGRFHGCCHTRHTVPFRKKVMSGCPNNVFTVIIPNFTVKLEQRG